MLGESFDSKAEFSIHERCRPHWSQAGAVVFITFRTADSIPQEVVARWENEKREWLNKKGVATIKHWSVVRTAHTWDKIAAWVQEKLQPTQGSVFRFLPGWVRIAATWIGEDRTWFVALFRWRPLPNGRFHRDAKSRAFALCISLGRSINYSMSIMASFFGTSDKYQAWAERSILAAGAIWSFSTKPWAVWLFAWLHCRQRKEGWVKCGAVFVSQVWRIVFLTLAVW